MSIRPDEINWYKSERIDDSSKNGGCVSDVMSLSGVKNDIWPDVSDEERKIGSVRYRKGFIRVENPNKLILIDPKIYIETSTIYNAYITIIPASATDTQDNIGVDSRMYGFGVAIKRISEGASGTFVRVPSAKDNVFRKGDLVRISTQTHVDDDIGESHFIRISEVTKIYVDNVIFVRFEKRFYSEAGIGLLDAKISSVYEPDNGTIFNFWEKRVVPAGAKGTFGNKCIVAISGESS